MEQVGWVIWNRGQNYGGNRVVESMTDIRHRKAAAQNSLNYSQTA